MFDGATIRLYGAEILVVLVQPGVLADPYESQLLVIAFAGRFARTIVLAAQDSQGVPTYYGPAAIARALGGLPFDALTWRRYRFRRPPPVKLPIPVEPDDWRAHRTDSQPSWSYCEPPDTEPDETTVRIARAPAPRDASTQNLRPRS